MAETNQSKSNFTNLLNTYMYGKVNDKINFYKYYKNDKNSIDDPIFTGFTFSIDNLHSPLFYTGTGDLYTSPDTLRSINEIGDESNNSLAESIEKRLTYVYKYAIKGAPDSYEINTLSAKDYIDAMNAYRAGYGLWDKVYMDNVLYGATDYIYMVDKVSVSNVYDELGVADLGNGTLAESIYDKYNNTINTANFIENNSLYEVEETITPDGDIIINETTLPSEPSDGDYNTFNLEKQIERLQQSLETPSYLDNKTDYDIHFEKENEKNTAKEAYDAAKKEYDEYKHDADHLTELIGNEKNLIMEDFQKLQSSISTKFAEWRSNPSGDTGALSALITEWEAFKQDANDSVNGNSGIYLYNKVYIEEPKSVDERPEEFEKELFEASCRARDAKITSISPNNVTQDTMKTQKSYINECERKLFGVDARGNICSESNPVKNSIYGNYQNLSYEYNNDTYSKKIEQIRELQEAKDNYYDTMEYNDYVADKIKNKVGMIPQTPVVDQGVGENNDHYENRVRAARETRKTYEVPQTVYDMLGFISGMYKLTTQYPYIMNSITGLDEAYKKYFNIKDPYMGSGDDKITISCYESLDLRVSSMFNKYLNAVYDRQYRRERVPVNLRRFNCSVFVHDIRNFRNSLANIGDNRFIESPFGDDAVSKIVEIALNSISAIEFKFFDCEIIPEETGSIFNNVTNESQGEMRQTSFSFKYGNCIINFLPFEDLNNYYSPGSTMSKSELKDYESEKYRYKMEDLLGDTYIKNAGGNPDYRRWYDKSELGNVNNNDYREYIRHDTSVAVDDRYKTTIVNNFALGSLSNKNKEATALNDSLRRIVTGISASTGVPVKGVTDALNIKFIDPIINGSDEESAVVKRLGNVTNIEHIRKHNTDYLGTTNGFEEQQPDDVHDLGKIK